jgi:hypothetical protein
MQVVEKRQEMERMIREEESEEEEEEAPRHLAPAAGADDAADGFGGRSVGSALKASAPAFVPGRRPRAAH